MDKTKKHILKRAGTCVAVVLMLYLFNRLTNQAFFSQRNLTMLLKQASVLMILTSSLMLLLIETNIDLSGGAGVYLSGVTCALLVVKCGWPIFPAIVVTIMVGIMMGAVNGFFIGRIGLPAFIVTLAAQQIFRGTGYVLTDCATIGPMPKQFTAISENFIPPAISVAAVILIFAAFGMLTVLTTVFLANTVDYGEMKNHRRDESVIFSMQTFVVKLASGVAVLIAAICLSLCNLKQDTSAAVVARAADSSVLGLRLTMAGIPMIGLFIAVLVFRKKYILTEKKLQEINAAIKNQENC